MQSVRDLLHGKRLFSGHEKTDNVAVLKRSESEMEKSKMLKQMYADR